MSPEDKRAQFRKRYVANPAKWRAIVAVNRAIKTGKLQKPSVCPVCLNERRIEGHHHRGYQKKHWLDVVWRCRQCATLERTRSLLILNNKPVS